MKEFIEKLIERLEEEKEKAFSQYRESFELYREEFWRGRMGGFTNAIEIANQLAEEHKDKDCSKCSRRSWYQKGYADAEKKIAEESTISNMETVGTDINVVRNGWIPCSERLPEDFAIVYATCVSLIDAREPWVIEGVYHSRFGWENFTPMISWGDAKVIAWMPKELPAPYQPDKQ